jgi:hypothetical protein
MDFSRTTRFAPPAPACVASPRIEVFGRDSVKIAAQRGASGNPGTGGMLSTDSDQAKPPYMGRSRGGAST